MTRTNCKKCGRSLSMCTACDGKAAAVVFIPVGVMALLSIILAIVIWASILVVFNSVGI